MEIDLATGLYWKDISSLLNEAFSDFKKDFSDVYEKLQLAANLLAQCENFRLVFSGSVAEGTSLAPSSRGGVLELDIMVTSCHTLSPEEQLEVFEDIPDHPGFLRIRFAREELKKRLRHPWLFRTMSESDEEGKKTLFYLSNRQTPFIFAFHSLLSEILRDPSKPFVLPLKSFYDSLLSSGLKEHFSGVVKYCGGAAVTLEGDVKFPGSSDIDDFIVDFFKGSFSKIIRKVLAPTDAMLPGHSRLPVASDALIYRKFSTDLVAAMYCSGWPSIADGFFHRERRWPTPSILDQIRNDGFFIVNKSPFKNPTGLEWRLSFSNAEKTLFAHMTELMRHCFCVFKGIYYQELTTPNVLSSYYLKTIFLWKCERMPMNVWVERNVAQVIMGLLDDLLHCLVNKHCPHYFMPTCNLLENAHGDFLLHLARTVLQIRRDPKRFFNRSRRDALLNPYARDHNKYKDKAASSAS
ncbi:predicted protein [Nematostella vectensis]|uniref:Mab21-like protein n=1 Tax=Nematostella vectensis TaxID=45351 RepID=A7S337_NEMVE|nr:mab21-like protein [Nematostella vectensis]EDO41925.1 predicted protein [Nematostella vectensis]|eukprot:XP_001633988.1 predicted protein [Nematostella vectensis]